MVHIKGHVHYLIISGYYNNVERGLEMIVGRKLDRYQYVHIIKIFVSA